MDSGASTRGFKCQQCAKHFSREEHVKRHELTHSKNKPFRCQTCSKGFIRRDALQRHESLHVGVPNLLQKGARACNSCATAKARCSGVLSGCARCQTRGQPCTYPIQSPIPLQTDSIASFVESTSVRDAQPAANEDLYLDDDFFNADILSATNWLDALADGSPTFHFNAGLHDASQLGGFLGPQDSLGTPKSTYSLSGTATSPRSAQSDQVETCATYVFGQSSRPPHVKRDRSTALTCDPSYQRPYEGFALTWQPGNTIDLACPVEIPPGTYDQIVAAFHHSCLANWNGLAAFVPSNPPSKELLQRLIHLYWTSFHPVMPFLHHVLDQSISNVCLSLAMCAIGSQYMEAPEQFITSMHEWTRRTLAGAHAYPQEGKCLAQARLLYYVCSTYHDVATRSEAFNGRETLKDIFSEAKADFWNMKECSNYPELSWEMWSLHEQVKRLAYSAWLLDAMHATHSQVKPILTLDDANLPLPCDDQMWEAQTSTEWKTLLATKTPSPTLQESLQQIYISKRLPRDRGEFARILMIHGLYHRLWEVSRYYGNPLSSWDPTGQQQEINLHDPIWLPSVPAYSKWQNSTCDALDILHWQANATIGQQSGFEHPTVLHLHFARVFLLVPCEDLVTMAKHRTGLYGIDQARSAAATEQVQRWALQHQYKARLAAVHAGVLFWHVRHHSADAFYEAPVVALAVLTLWAFGTFARRHGSNTREQWPVVPTSSSEQPVSSAAAGLHVPTQNHTSLEATDEDGVCDIILLDRPTDDELVQQFIRRGHRMQAHITGVGDLYGAEGPARVLRKGHKLLRTLKYWKRNVPWLELLSELSCKE